MKAKYNMDWEVADKITSLFLKKFREVRHDPKSECVDEWRIKLWKEALGPTYSHLSDEIYNQWLSMRFQYLQLKPDVKSFLDELKDTYRLALISNGSSEPQWEKIKACGVEPIFECIVVSGDTPWAKPEREIFYKACGELNVNPENCMMIGDRVETDIVGAKNAELAASVWICFDNSYQEPPQEKSFPDFIVNHVLEVKQILFQLNSNKWNNIS